MKPPPFDYVRAGSVEEAVSVLDARGGDAKVLAGGQSLMPMLNFRLLAPAVLLDINRVPGLDGIGETADGLRIGALVRHRRLEASPAVQVGFPIVTAAMAHVAHLAIRSRGTFAGSLSHADPAAELPMLAVLLDARITVAGPNGRRLVEARDFFDSALTTTLDETEIVTAIDLPALPAGAGWGFEEVARRLGDFALAAVGAIVTLRDGKAETVRLAVAGAGETPLRLAAAERTIAGETMSPALFDAAADATNADIDPMTDLHGSTDYRRHLVGVLTRRALQAAWRRAEGAAA